MGLVTGTVRDLAGRVDSIPILLEVVPDFAPAIKEQTSQMGLKGPYWDITIGDLRFLSYDAVRSELVTPLEGITGVEVVHHDADIKFFGPFGIFPILKDGLRLRDFVLGRNASPKNLRPAMTETKRDGYYGTAKAWELMGGEEASKEGYDGSGTTVCVIDTGVWNLATSFNRKVNSISISRYRLDKFFDSNGHGSWVCGMVSGDVAISPAGYVCRGMSKAQLVSIKALRSPRAVSRMSDILKALEMALNRPDVHIISLSLGTTATEAPNIDPMCKAISVITEKGKIVCVAAGNDGPDQGTVNTPGISGDAITVGAASITDEGAVSWFSSRGPEVDTVFYGGGRINESDEPKECLVGPTGYLSTTDLSDRSIGFRPRQSFAAMDGSSMATPGVAGIIAIWCDIYRKVVGREMTTGDVRTIISSGDGRTVKISWIWNQVDQPTPEPGPEPEPEPEPEPDRERPEPSPPLEPFAPSDRDEGFGFQPSKEVPDEMGDVEDVPKIVKTPRR